MRTRDFEVEIFEENQNSSLVLGLYRKLLEEDSRNLNLFISVVSRNLPQKMTFLTDNAFSLHRVEEWRVIQKDTENVSNFLIDSERLDLDQKLLFKDCLLIGVFTLLIKEEILEQTFRGILQGEFLVKDFQKLENF